MGGAPPTFSVVIETDNLERGEIAPLRECLDSIARQQPVLGRARGVVLVAGGNLSEASVEVLRDRYPWLTLDRTAGGVAYIGQKARGAALGDSEVVVFCDGDVRYEPGWLGALLAPFSERPDVEMVAGETTTPIQGPYTLAIALTFMFPRFSGESQLARSPTYWANNVAVRRSVLEVAPIPDPAVLYRGQNLLHSLALLRCGRIIWRQPLARAQHSVPGPRTIARRYLRLGRDARSIACLTREVAGRPYLAAMAPDRCGGNPLRKLAGRVRQVARTSPAKVAWLPLAVPVVGLLGLCYLAGRLGGGSPAGS
jgi:glycosyltransferase involved in cell wall biosynthesis